MSEAYVIEIEDRAVGVVVREAGGYRFFASRARFAALENKVFGSPEKAHRAALQITGRVRPKVPDVVMARSRDQTECRTR